jgi:hypothetical protein
MSQDGDIKLSDNTVLLVNALKRWEPDTAKIMKKELNSLGTQGKRQLVANTPSKTGFTKSRWAKRTSVTKTKVKVAVTISWPSGVPRYPFMVEHGRKAGLAGNPGKRRRFLAKIRVVDQPRRVTAMEPRKYIARTREQLAPNVAKTIDAIQTQASDAFTM